MDDAFGHALYDYQHDRYRGDAVFCRENGVVDEVSVPAYFAPPSEWAAHSREMVARTTGRVLDLGCGAGRASLALARAGHDVLAADRSPLAVRTTFERGVGCVSVMDLRSVGVSPGAVDSVLVMGQQLSSTDTRSALRERLDALTSVVRPGGRLVADFGDPTHESLASRTDDLHWIDASTATHSFTVEYGPYCGPRTTQLLLSPSALRDTLVGVPWEIDDLFFGSDSTYAAVFAVP